MPQELRPAVPESLRPQPGGDTLRVSAIGADGRRVASTKIRADAPVHGKLPLPTSGRVAVTRMAPDGRVTSRAVIPAKHARHVDLDRVAPKRKIKNPTRGIFNGNTFAPQSRRTFVRGLWNGPALKSSTPREFRRQKALGRQRSTRDLLA